MSNRFPPGWNEERVRKLIEHYETQTEDEAIAEDEAAYEATDSAMIQIPNELVPEVMELIEQYNARKAS